MGLMAAVLADPCAGGCARGIAGCSGPSQGLYLWADLEGITRLSCGEVCPSSGAGTLPASPGGAGGSPQSAFVPGLERMDWRQPRSAVSRRHRRPCRSGRGKGDRWRDGRMDGWTDTGMAGFGEAHPRASWELEVLLALRVPPETRGMQSPAEIPMLATWSGAGQTPLPAPGSHFCVRGDLYCRRSCYLIPPPALYGEETF